MRSNGTRPAAPAITSPAVSLAPLPMLARVEHQLPTAGDWVYEPKLDGFRGMLWHRSSGRVDLLIRNRRDLGPWFPELIRAGVALPRGTLADGEIVVADRHGAADFTAVQRRLGRDHMRPVQIAGPFSSCST